MREGDAAINRMLLCERKAFCEGASIIIGVDEAGRGPLAGPVVAAAIVLKPAPLKKFIIPRYKERIDDSKRLRPAQRNRAFSELRQRALFGVGLKDNIFIDTNNIKAATLEAMRQAVINLIKKYCRLNNKKEKDIKRNVCILIDGNMSPALPYKTIRILKGDSRSLSIAAASIIAKVIRDRIMVSYDRLFPQYGFFRHKGYGTRFHMGAIQRFGPCTIHRRSFSPIKRYDPV